MQGQTERQISNLPMATTGNYRLLHPKREAAHLLGVSIRKLDYLIAEGG